MEAGFHSSGVAGEDEGEVVVFVGVGFGVLVEESDDGVIEKRSFAFADGFEFAEEVGEFVDVPAADIAKDAHAAGGFNFAVGVFVVALGGVAEPGEAGEALALGEHVGGDVGLLGGQGVDEEIALEFGDAGVVAEVAGFGGAVDGLGVFGR